MILVNTILNKEKGCRRQGATSCQEALGSYACKCAAPGTATSGEGHIRLLGKIMQLRHTHPRLISRPMRHLHVATQNLFSLLNFADLSCEECSGKGFFWAGGCPQARSRDKDGRLASHNGTFTSPSPPHQKNPIYWVLLFIHHITVWGCCWADITLCLLYE